MKRGDFVLFLNDIYKYAFSFSLARTVRLFVKFPTNVLHVMV